jgi:hypothetical protein
MENDGAKMPTNDISLQVAETTGIAAAVFHADMDESVQKDDND